MVPRLRETRPRGQRRPGRENHTIWEPIFSRSLYIFNDLTTIMYMASSTQPITPSERVRSRGFPPHPDNSIRRQNQKNKCNALQIGYTVIRYTCGQCFDTWSIVNEFSKDKNHGTISDLHCILYVLFWGPQAASWASVVRAQEMHVMRHRVQLLFVHATRFSLLVKLSLEINFLTH